MTKAVNSVDKNQAIVLIVDDQPQNTEILSTMLQFEGYKTLTATNGLDALRIAAESLPHLIVLDILMPGMIGFEVCRQLKAIPETRDIPVIFVSALGELSDRIKAFDMGGVDYLVKPINVTEALARIRTHTTLRQHQLEIIQLRQQDAERIIQLQNEVGHRKATELALHQVIQRLSLLNRMISSTSMTISLQRLMHMISHDLQEAFRADKIVTLVIESREQTATIAATIPETLADELAIEPIPLSKPMFQHLYEYPVPLKLVDIHRNSLCEGMVEQLFPESTQSVLALSMRSQGNMIGVFFICYDEPHEFSSEDVLLGTEVSQAASQAVENSILHQKLATHNKQLGAIVAERTAQLNHLNKRMIAIFSSITDGIILIHPDGTIDITNSAFDTMLGYYPDELFGKPILPIVQSNYHHQIQVAFDAARNGGRQTHIQVQAVRKDGSTIDVDMAFSSVKDEENHVLCNCHDISNLKQMERIKDNFISMVTHELRTPITNIMLTSGQMMKYMERMTQEQFARKIEQLDMQAHVLAELVESVLDISRLESQVSKPRDREINIAEIVQGVMSELEHAAQDKQQTLSVLCDPEPQILAGDDVDFSRIWRNLIGNAIKYTQNAGAINAHLGTVVIHTDTSPSISPALVATPCLDKHTLAQGAYCVGQVIDNGHGISPEDQKHIFKRFQRGWAKQSSIPGTGLGLALVKELLEMYGGGIALESTVGQGTMFTFWIPYTKDTNHTANNQPIRVNQN
jgi:PAS domain S-box-containing protein